jgi:hypothetical protein
MSGNADTQLAMMDSDQGHARDGRGMSAVIHARAERRRRPNGRSDMSVAPVGGLPWHGGPVNDGDGAFVPAIRHMRTDAERRDQLLSWSRPDDAFFASGACHILAFRFCHRHAERSHRIILIHPTNDLPGAHVYVESQGWAFDFNGWTPEDVLLSRTAAECRTRWPGWDYERVEVFDVDLPAFCARWGHRPAAGFALNVIERADRFVERFPARHDS